MVRAILLYMYTAVGACLTPVSLSLGLLCHLELTGMTASFSEMMSTDRAGALLAAACVTLRSPRTISSVSIASCEYIWVILSAARSSPPVRMAVHATAGKGCQSTSSSFIQQMEAAVMSRETREETKHHLTVGQKEERIVTHLYVWGRERGEVRVRAGEEERREAQAARTWRASWVVHAASIPVLPRRESRR